ncbi:hypothetical protein TRFO_19036 [Tritrichomonas foetus]|uniref:Uncharacterized protein n=1 Tax=Tritrichomonas foetus TaxID=1144522 RepID=A0A1J4KJJ7_9EUKA|nr:hypothetical protein TRFO_19036 [Tritrichomonas foetus]|eukprot:OHT11497.1 hypothetical protein TRFO_19036 [Tritrichomonas foetus]
MMISSKSLQTAPSFHSRALKKSRPTNSNKFHFEQTTQFKNPLLGIEVSLNEKLHENKRLFKDSVVRKKNFLIDALEDIALTNLGYQEQISQVVSFYRKPVSEDMETRLRSTKQDIEHAQDYLNGLKKEDLELDQTLKQLEEEIEKVEKETLDYQDKIDEVRKNIYSNVDLFARYRLIGDALKGLQADFNDMFVNAKPPKYYSENEEMGKDNENQRRNLARLKNELQITNQVSKRLKTIGKLEKIGKIENV